MLGWTVDPAPAGPHGYEGRVSKGRLRRQQLLREWTEGSVGLSLLTS
jgi:hypothetical protein